MESFDLNDMFQDPEMAERARDAVQRVSERIDQAMIDYKFMVQMLGDNLPIPTPDAVAVIAAQAFARKLREWDGEDFMIPLMFGVLMTRGGLHYDHA